MVDMRDIPQVIYRMVLRIIEELAPQRVVLFGSYAYGHPDRDSDIDLLIVLDTKDRFIDRFVRVQEVVSGLHTGIPFDPLVLTPSELERRLAIGDQFIQKILNKGKVLYAA